MSQENVELAREVLATLGMNDPVRLTALSDPEVEWQSFFALGEHGGIYRGHEGTRRYMQDLADAWDVARAEIDDTLGIGDVVVLVGRIHYRGRGSGIESATAAGWMLKFRGGKLLRFHAFREPTQALEAAGLED
jgi:ketosteroid isomerase-like protein